MRLIDAKKAVEHIQKRLIETALNNAGVVCEASSLYTDIVNHRIDTWMSEVLTVDAEPVIRCCNCHWFSDRTKAVSTTPEGEDIAWCVCWIHDDIMPENGYCSKAERKDKDE